MITQEKTEEELKNMTTEEYLAYWKPIHNANMKFIQDIKDKDYAIINPNFDYAEPCYGSGAVVCKHCQKQFKWSEWGAGRSRALTFAGKHIAKEHGVGGYRFSSPITIRSHFVNWVDERYHELEMYEIANAPNYKVGDKVEILGEKGRTGTIVEIIDKNHKDAFFIGKNHQIVLVIEQDPSLNSFWRGKLQCDVTQIKLIEGKSQ